MAEDNFLVFFYIFVPLTLLFKINCFYGEARLQRPGNLQGRLPKIYIEGKKVLVYIYKHRTKLCKSLKRKNH